MSDNCAISNNTEKIIIKNRLFETLINGSNECFILVDVKSHKIIEVMGDKKVISGIEAIDDFAKIDELIDDISFDKIMNGESLLMGINGNQVNVHCEIEGNYAWFYFEDRSDDILMKNKSDKAIELNRELLAVFDEYGDDTVMVANCKGIIEFAGERISSNCGVSANYFEGRSVYDMEEQGIFKPSVIVKVLETRKPQVVMQRTKIGEDLVAIGAPILEDEGNINKVVSVTKNFSTQLKISKMIAEMGDTNGLKTTAKEDDDKIVTCNEKMFEIKSLARMIAATKATVLINGETGTGKEVIARNIYNLSDRSDKPFVKVNCGAISRSLVESELFGYEEGSFTGASKGGKIGLIEAANGGTLFLDEVSELPLEQQVKLLHVLQEKLVTRVGGTKSIGVDVRIIAATNKDLEEQMALGNFREDLYYRLNVIPINLPPLRARKEDILLLSKYFFNRACEAYGKEKRLSNDALAVFERYTWPGNIRQLENAIERLVLTVSNPIVSAEDLPSDLFDHDEQIPAVKVDHIVKMEDAIKLLEKDLISMAMDECGTTVKAAKMLGVNQSTVSRKITQYGIDKPDNTQSE